MTARDRKTRLPRRAARLRRWLRKHDDRWIFTLVYVGLAVVLSMAISLFWLVVVIAMHGVLEYWSLRQRSGHRLGRVLWHVKLDIALVLFALCLGLYMEVLFGMAGLSAATRTAAQAGSRVLAWQRTLRGVLLTLDDAAVIARSAVGGNGGEAASKPMLHGPPWRLPWTPGDRFSIALGVGFAALILLAPVLTDHSAASTLHTLAVDLHPWPG